MSSQEFKAGWVANANFQPLKSCPYEKGTKEAKHWCAGWYGANEDPVVLSEKSAYV